MAIAAQLAEFACATTFDSLSDGVLQNDKLHLLDAIGLAVSSSRQPFAQQIRDIAYDEVRQRCRANSPTVEQLSASDVGLVLGAMVHGQDYDDTHTETLIHPSSCIASAALALAFAHDLDGRQLLELLAIGYEVIIRIGCGSGPGAQMQARGFHGTSIAGACAAAVMCARSSTCDPERVRNALAIAAGLGAGLWESANDGSFAKAIQPGWAVKAGFWAAGAAEAGITGPILIFEGQRGLYASHAGLDKCEPERATDGLGSRWEHLKTDFKLYPVCHQLQAPAEAALSAREELGADDLASIRQVVVQLSEQQVPAVCEPRQSRLAPTNVYAARFSLPFVVAVGLAYGRIGEEEISRGLRDESVLRLATRVVHRGVPNPDFPMVMPIEMQVTTADGRSITTSCASSPGTYGRTVRAEEIEAKFRRNVGESLDPAEAAQVMRMVREMESETDLGPLVHLVLECCLSGV